MESHRPIDNYGDLNQAFARRGYFVAIQVSNNRAAITEAFLANKASLARYITTFFVGREEIEDTLQQTYLKTLVSGSRTEIRAPQAYLFRVARNIALNKITRNRKIFFENVESVDDALASQMAEAETHDLSDLVYSQEKLAAFTEAVESLPPRCRTVFLMQKIDGSTYKEIGNELGISVRTVEKHLEKGLKRCAEHLGRKGFLTHDGEAGKTAKSSK